ncbi:MAG: TonB family protein [Selenomonadaceae bacterium]|nr:TonB family protein [Selenomonadaceae bacterium]
MNGYSTYWRTTIFAAIALHLLAGLGIAYVLPHLIPEPTLEIVQEMDWIDVDLNEPEPVVLDEQAIPLDEPSEPEEVYSEFDFPPLVIPDIPIEPTVSEPPPPPPKPLEPPKVEPPPAPPQSKPTVVKDDAEVVKQLEKNPESEVVVAKGKQLLGEPPITLNEYYPPEGSGLNYKGYVSVAATIGKDGLVKRTKIMRTSGRMMVDNIAMSAAQKWTFKPALDQEGKPMECDKIITFDFKKF